MDTPQLPLPTTPARVRQQHERAVSELTGMGKLRNLLTGRLDPEARALVDQLYHAQQLTVARLEGERMALLSQPIW